MLKGEDDMPKITNLLNQTIFELYKNYGWSIKEIAGQFKIKERTIISIVEKRETTNRCLCCGKEITQTPGHRKKEFCSSCCYRKWRRENVLNSSAKHVCQWCGKDFIDPYHLNAKYCSRKCRNDSYKKK